MANNTRCGALEGGDLQYSVMDEYLAPKTQQNFELEIKRSRFITSVVPVDGKESAKAALSVIRSTWPDANHHCWAMVAGKPTDVFQQDQSDDGEPKGTAGKPMLNVLVHSGLGNTLVVVTRFFGGVKLGAGGLVRAYSQSVSEALAQTQTTPVMLREHLDVVLEYSNFATLEHRLKELETRIVQRNFTDTVQLRLAYPARQLDALESLLQVMGATWQDG